MFDLIDIVGFVINDWICSGSVLSSTAKEGIPFFVSIVDIIEKKAF
jgi:hypothetical protein